MYTLAIVWMLSNGNILGEPWRDFDNFDACQVAKEAYKGDAQKYLFITGCFHKETMPRFIGFDMRLIEGEKK